MVKVGWIVGIVIVIRFSWDAQLLPRNPSETADVDQLRWIKAQIERDSRVISGDLYYLLELCRAQLTGGHPHAGDIPHITTFNN